MDKHEIAAQINAGIAADAIPGYDADASAEWSSKHDQQVHVIDGLLYAQNAHSGQWYGAARVAPKVHRDDRSPAAEAYRVGAGCGVNGQIWDNA